MARVYLAGPISGLSYHAATDWRRDIISQLSTDSVKMRVPHKAYSPMRRKMYLQGFEAIPPFSDPQTDAQVFSRDVYDIQTADVLLVNLIGATKPSCGTLIEIGMAYAQRKPIFIAMEEINNPHDSLFVRQVTPFIRPTLDEAYNLMLEVIDQ